MVRRAALVLAAGVAASAAGVPAAAQVVLPAVHLQTSISTGPHLFGDKVHARLDVFVDRGRVEPGTVRVDTKFFPYTRVGTPRRAEATSGSTTRISYAYTVECLTLRCYTGRAKLQVKLTFPVAIARYRERSGARRGLAVKWPIFRLVSRLPPESEAEFRANTSGIQLGASPASELFAPLAVPATTYRLSPALLAALLLGGALLAVAAAGMIGRPVLAHLRETSRASDEPTLTSLERALERVEGSAAASGRGDRGALAWLARELPQADLQALVPRARRLAWSEHEPTADESLELAQRVRTALEGGG